ncbi:hypothetical protein MRX96_000994 [Rhipicephalus microplus]
MALEINVTFEAESSSSGKKAENHFFKVPTDNSPTPRRRAFDTADSNDWTTTNPANTAVITADDFPNRTDLADKTNAI